MLVLLWVTDGSVGHQMICEAKYIFWHVFNYFCRVCLCLWLPFGILTLICFCFFSLDRFVIVMSREKNNLVWIKCIQLHDANVLCWMANEHQRREFEYPKLFTVEVLEFFLLQSLLLTYKFSVHKILIEYLIYFAFINSALYETV